MRKKSNDNKEKAVNQQSRGQRLRSLRQSRGISLDEAYRETKIHPSILKALEQDAVGGMSSAHIKGLLKVYCSFLGVDSRDFIEEKQAETQPLPPDPVQNANPPQEAPKASPEPVLLKRRIDLSAIKKIKLKPLIIVISLTLLVAVLFRAGRDIGRYFSSRPKRPAADSVVSKPEAPVVRPVSGEPELGIRAKEDCWLEVRTDGKLVFRHVLKKGSYGHWTAEGKIEFSLGNAAAVEVEVNGRLLPPLGRRGQAVRNVVVTKEGLVVPE